jgi:hypothetical protein
MYFGIPECYLGGNIDILDDQWSINGMTTALSARTYLSNITERMETMFGHELRKFKTPMDETYHPELDDTPMLTPKEASKYCGMVGCCNWVITLGRFDISYTIQALSRYTMAPQEGDFKAMKRVMRYVKKHYKGRLIIDPKMRDWSMYSMETADNWGEFYPSASEELPHNMPPPKGRNARITVFIDADHAHDQLTRRSVTGILLFINNTPVKWIKKRHLSLLRTNLSWLLPG